MSKIILRKGKEGSIKRFHPWIFSGALLKLEGNPNDGDVVEVYSFNDEFLGCGHFQSGSITVRMLSFDEAAKSTAFWRESIEKALKKREIFGLTTNIQNTNAYRLVNGEGDNLPGLIIDFYNGTAVIQAHSAGMVKSVPGISKALREVYGDKLLSVYNKSSMTAPERGNLVISDGYIIDGQRNALILENGIFFNVNWEEGQKTGFFLDQRDNRELVRKYATGKSVLNLFCYTGGFSLYALSGGAKLVDSVDSSQKAINLLNENIKLNIEKGIIPDGIINNSFCEDAIKFLKDSPAGKYDLMIVDPPAFAKHRGAVGNALRAYQRLNASAIERVAPGGIIFTFSCSQAIDKISFAQAIFSAAAQTGRRASIIGRLTQPADHSVNIYHPEGEYLKGLILYVE
jgi:23S rRNA (cytosine1962-C5)-methyltransferase